MTDTMTSQIIDLSSWHTLCIHSKLKQNTYAVPLPRNKLWHGIVTRSVYPQNTQDTFLLVHFT
jgi:hypothetical protein